MKDFNDLHYFLGIEVVCSCSDLFLMQQKHNIDLLHKFQLQTTKPIRTTSATQATLSLHDGELGANPSYYRSMVGSYSI